MVVVSVDPSIALVKPTCHVNVQQLIRANTPAGTYTVTGNAGTFPAAKVSDSFTLQKVATALGRLVPG